MSSNRKKSFFWICKIILNVLILSTPARAARLELDEENSTYFISYSVSAYAGTDSDSYTYQDSSLSYSDPLCPRNLVVTDSIAWAQIVICSEWDTFGGDYTGGHHLFWDAICSAFPYSDEDTEQPAGFSITMNAEGNLVWEIVKSTEYEDANLPVFLHITDWGSDLIATGASNTSYEMGIYNYTCGPEGETYGPYSMESYCCPSGQNSTFPEEGDIWAVAHFGDSIGLSYNTSVSGMTDDPMTNSIFSGPVVNVGQSIIAFPPEIIFLDREQFGEVEGACADGETRVGIHLYLPYDLFPDDENPACIQLTVLSVEGKDNGHLIEKGQDNDGDSYDDTPRIENNVFTQTWCAPDVFDSVEGVANTAKSRQIPIQFEIDKDNDGTYDAVFVKHIELFRPPVVMVHGLWSNARAFANLEKELNNKGFMFTYCPSYNNSASFATNDRVLPRAINNILKNLRTTGETACTKVDIVAHSMGGLLAKRIDPSFAQKNVLKIITIGSPYQGSPLADLLINDILVNNPMLFGYLENFIFDKIIAHNEHSLSGGALHNLRCNGGISVNPDISGVDCSGIIVGLRDGSFDVSVEGLLLGVYLKALRTAKKLDNDAVHNYLFGADTSDWVVSTSSQRGGATSLPPIDVMWHLTETKDENFKTLVVDLLNDRAQLTKTSEHLTAGQRMMPKSKEQVLSAEEGIYSKGTITRNKAELTDTIEIIAPIEDQTCTAGESITIEVRGSEDTTKAALFAFFGTYPWAEIVELPWSGEVNIPPDTVGPAGQITALGLDANMDMTSVDEVNVVLDTNVVLEDIFFGFGNKWIFDFKTFPQQLHEFQLYPMGVFSNGAQYPLSVLGQTSYESSDANVTTVDPDGLITAHSKGTNEITVTNSGVDTIIEVEVDTYLGDINLDGKVNFTDFAVLANQWEESPGYPSADIAPQGSDFIVDIYDLAVLCDNWLAGK